MPVLAIFTSGVGPNFQLMDLAMCLGNFQAHPSNSSARHVLQRTPILTIQTTMGFDKKRKRSDSAVKRFKGQGNSAKRQKTSVEKRVVHVDKLPWKTVDVPEMFDDAEGFYGLEEVTGVEVIREGNTVKFVCLSGQFIMPFAYTRSGCCCPSVR
jgi:hypothetical protein